MGGDRHGCERENPRRRRRCRIARTRDRPARRARRVDPRDSRRGARERPTATGRDGRIQCPGSGSREKLRTASGGKGRRNLNYRRAPGHSCRCGRSVPFRVTRSGGDAVIVVFDVGNSEITIGTFEGDELISHWRLTTGAPRTADEMALLIRSLTGIETGSRSTIQGSAIASVVPAITPVLAEACEVSFGRTPVMIDGRAKLPIKLDVEEPFTVGAD